MNLKRLIRTIISESLQNKTYYSGKTRKAHADGRIYITDSPEYARVYAAENNLDMYHIPFSDDKLFSIRNTSHLNSLRGLIGDENVQHILKSSRPGQEMDWAAIDYISNDDHEESEDILMEMGFLGVKLQERDGIDSILIFNKQNLKQIGQQ